jgi:hypothetical protein
MHKFGEDRAGCAPVQADRPEDGRLDGVVGVDDDAAAEVRQPGQRRRQLRPVHGHDEEVLRSGLLARAGCDPWQFAPQALQRVGAAAVGQRRGDADTRQGGDWPFSGAKTMRQNGYGQEEHVCRVKSPATGGRHAHRYPGSDIRG